MVSLTRPVPSDLLSSWVIWQVRPEHCVKWLRDPIRANLLARGRLAVLLERGRRERPLLLRIQTQIVGSVSLIHL